MQIKIEKNVPMPGGNSKDGHIVAAIRKMEVGDSILVKASSQAAVYAYGRRNGASFRSSTRAEYAPAGYIRFWLTKPATPTA